MGAYRFQLLGGMKITIDDMVITKISSKRAMLLLAYVILEDDLPRMRRQIAYHFWPNSNEKQALSNLRKLIYDLRDSLPQLDRYFKITSASLQWNNDLPCSLDVREFEHAAEGQTLHELKEAEKLYRGELLPGFYEEWVLTKRDHYAHLYIKVLEKIIVQLESIRDYSSAVLYANKLLNVNKLNEEYYRTLMRLHVLNGDAASVVTIYEQLRTMLNEEFGIIPDEETTKLYRRFTENKHNHELHTIDVPNHSSLIGRLEEWGIMLRTWKKTTEGLNSMLLMKGDAGIGKSKLAHEFKIWVESQGIHTSITNCYSSLRTLSYSPITNWLRNMPMSTMNVVSLSELSRILPELYDQYPGLPVPIPIQENWQLNNMYYSIERMLHTEQPLLLILDDIQWCDKESLQLISYLLRRESKAKLLIIATLRTDEVPHAAALQLFSELQTEQKLTQVEIAPLSKNDTKILMALTVGHATADHHLSSIYAITGGNPLFIEETMKGWQTGSDIQEIHQSPVVKTTIRNRFNKLNDNKDLIGVIAAIGKPATSELLSHILDVNEEFVLKKLELLVQLKILMEVGSGKHDFVHDVLRGVAYSMMSDSRRRRCHRQIARALQTFNDSHPVIVAAEIAYHLELAGIEQEAIPYYKLSALEAEKIFAYETVVNNYQKLILLLPEDEILFYVLKIGETWTTVGDWSEAERTYRNWLEHKGYSASIRDRSHCDVALGNCLRLQGKYDEARFHLERALRYFELLGDNTGLSVAYGALGILHYVWGNYDKAEFYLLRRIELPELDNRTKDDCRFFYFVGFLFYDQCDYEQAIYWFNKQIMLATEIKDNHGVELAMGGLTLTYLDMDELKQAYEHAVEKIKINKSIGNRMELATAVGMLGKYYLYAGHRPHASLCLNYCLEEAVIIKDWRIAAIVIGLEARNQMEQSHYEEANVLLERTLRIFRKLNNLYFICETLYDLSLLKYEQNQLISAMEFAIEALELANQLKRKDMQFMLTLHMNQLEIKQGVITTQEAMKEIEGMIALYTDLQQQATLHYLLWRLTGKQFDQSPTARSLNEQLYVRSGRQMYYDRCYEMNSPITVIHALPLPMFVEGVTSSARMNPTVLDKIDYYLSN